MARKIAITVHPSATEADCLTVGDAMRQVLDIIETLERIDSPDGNLGGIVWRLESASANSPFSVVATAGSPDPGLSVVLEANRVTDAFASSLEGVLRDDHLPVALNPAAAAPIARFLKRNLNGIGRTDIAFPDTDAPAIFILPPAAQRGLLAIERLELEDAEAHPNLARSEFGAREGEIAGLVTYYDHAALLIRDRLTGEKFTAVLAAELAARLGPEHSWKEAWSGQRIVVTGALHYDAAGRVRRVDAEELEPVNPSSVSLADLEGIDLLAGRTVSEHLARVWGDDG